MKKINVNWSGIFVDAFTYTSNILLFMLTIVVFSVFWVWISEKPQFYKLIFKKSKHSNMLTPVESNEHLEHDNILNDNEISTTTVLKRLAEISKDKIEPNI